MTPKPPTDTSRGAGDLTIGGIVVDPPLVLGPMAGHTSLAFRLLCRRAGAGLCVGEMISAKALEFDNAKTHCLMRTCPQERPVAVQLFGGSPDVLYNAVSAAEAAGADIIDLNMGCCVPKVRSGGAGIELMADPERGIACARAIVEATSVPVTVKMRTGMEPGEGTYLRMAPRLEEAGVAALCLHARNAADRMRGRADWSHIGRLVDAVTIPVIGNGDVVEPADAVRMLEQTACAGVMVGRGAIGRPWVFMQMAAAVRGEPVAQFRDPAGIMGIALCHAQMLALHLGERTAVHQMRGEMAHYSRGLPGAARLRQALQVVGSLAQLTRAIEDYVGSL